MPALSRRSLRRLLVATVLAVAGAVGCTQLDAWQRQAIFSPETDQRWWREPPAGTEIYDLALDNGDKVRAWYWQAPRADAPTVLYLHGARWNLNGSAFRMDAWTRMGYSMLAIDYRGFGESTTLLPSQDTALQDASAALAELARRQPDPARRFLYGHSLGGAIAIDLMARLDPPIPVAGLIVEATFTSIRDMIATTRWAGIPGFGLLVTQPFDSRDAIGKLRTPLLLLHGTGDRVVPPAMSDALLAAARQSPHKRLVWLEGASHSGTSRSGAAYDDAVRGFIRSVRQAYPG